MKQIESLERFRDTQQEINELDVKTDKSMVKIFKIQSNLNAVFMLWLIGLTIMFFVLAIK